MIRTAVLLVDCPDAKGIVPVEARRKVEAESVQIDLIERNAIDLTVLARYMHVLSPAFVARYPLRVINVEKILLSRAVRWHPEHRILFYGNKSVVFD